MSIFQNLDAINVGHLDVGHHHIVECGLQLPLRHFPGVDRLDLISFTTQSDVEHFADGALVVADQDIRHARPLLSALPALRLQLQTATAPLELR